MSAMRYLFVIAVAVIASACAKTIITSPTATAADTATLIKEFSSQLVPGGSASREFEITAAGSIGVTLKTTTPSGITMGLGVGIPRANGSCALNAAVETAAGASAQITIPADVGTYCAKVYDLGTLEGPVPFTLSISRP